MINKINNLDDLIEHCSDTLMQLKRREIEVDESCAVSEMSKTIVGALKVKLTHCHMTNEKPNIKFIGNCNQENCDILEKKSAKSLLTQGIK